MDNNEDDVLGSLPLGDLDGAVRREAGYRADEAWDALRSFHDDVSRENFVGLLEVATAERAISPHCLLASRFWAGTYCLRFTGWLDELVLAIARPDGSDELARASWFEGKRIVDVLADLQGQLRRDGLESLVQLADASSFQQGVLAIQIGLEARFGSLPWELARLSTARVPGDLGPVIAVMGAQWALTDDGLEGIDHRYVIEFRRLSELDWLDHVGGKAWVDRDEFADAFDVARAYFNSGGGS